MLRMRDWAERIAEDWREIRDEVKAVPGLTDEQKQRADAAYVERTRAGRRLPGR